MVRRLRQVLWVIAGLALAVLGIVGLVLPVMPGLVLLVGAAACLSMASTRFRTRVESRLHRHPRYRLALLQWRAGAGLPAWRRAQLGFWLTVSSLLPAQRR